MQMAFFLLFEDNFRDKSNSRQINSDLDVSGFTTMLLI